MSKGITEPLPEDTMLGHVTTAARRAFHRHVRAVTVAEGTVHVTLEGKRGHAVSFHGHTNIDALDFAAKCMSMMEEGEYAD